MIPTRILMRIMRGGKMDCELVKAKWKRVVSGCEKYRRTGGMSRYNHFVSSRERDNAASEAVKRRRTREQKRETTQRNPQRKTLLRATWKMVETLSESSL